MWGFFKNKDSGITPFKANAVDPQTIKKLNERAQELGISKLFEHVASSIAIFPFWAKNSNNRKYFCSLVSNVNEKEYKNGNRRIRFTLKKKNYVFYYYKTTSADNFYGFMCWELYLDSNRILGASMSDDYRTEEDEKYKLRSWIIRKVDAFIEGEWIKDFKEYDEKYYAEVMNGEEERIREAKRVKEELKKIEEKRKFQERFGYLLR